MGEASERHVGQPESPPTPSSKLAFLEALLACDDVGSAARLAVDWLVRFAGVRQLAIVLLANEDPEGAHLVGVAAHGFGRLEPASIRIALTHELRLARALAAERPQSLPGDVLAGTPLSVAGGRCTVFPLPLTRGGATREAVGLAIVCGGRVPLVTDVLRSVGRRLADLRSVEQLVATEQRLARERELLQRILASVPDPVLLTDPDGRLLMANARAEHYFGCAEEDAESRRRTVALNNMLFAAALSRHSLDSSEHARVELPLVDAADGEGRLFELTSTPISTSDVRGVVSVLRNVTDLQLAAQEIHENYRRLRTAELEARAGRDRLDLIIDSVVDPIIVTDARGARLMTNAPAERLLTASPDAPLEEVLRVRANDAHLSSHVADLFFLEPGGRFRGELALVDPKTASPVPVEAISGKVLSDRGEVTAMVTILHDRTEQMEKSALYEELKRASSLLEDKVRDATAELVRQNELLQRQALELEAASSAKSQFLANMSHEFRTPLNAILGYTTMLLQGVAGPLPPGIARHLTRIDSNGRHLLTIISDILDIARIEAGRMPVNRVRFVAADLVKEVLSELEPLIARSRLSVCAKIGRSVPRLLTDRAKVKQILMNLLSNALKFTPKGSVVVSVRRLKRRGSRPDRVCISVADTGIGIAKKDQQLVFQDFRQVDNSPTRQYGGTGLGLAICQRLARVLGGEIRLVSELGVGSKVRLMLPVRGTSRGATEMRGASR